MSSPVIGFAGLTHLGLVSAAAAASHGFRVVAFDADSARVEAIGGGALPVVEPELPELITGSRARLTFTSDAAALGDCDIVYLAADVPTDATGASDLDPIRALADSAMPVLSEDALLIVLSQVPPGFTRGLALDPARLFCQVETLVFGDAVARACRPERIIVGCADPGAPLPSALDACLQAFDCPVLPMRYESAELAKIAINVMLAASVSATNTLAGLSETVGADWTEIAPALRLDRRIGPHAYLAPGPGIAGGNIERDLATVLRLAEDSGADAGVVRAWIADSAYRRDWALRVLHERQLGDAPVVAVLGLAYKAGTGSIRNSPALALIAGLGAGRIRAYDPVVKVADTGIAGLEQASGPLDACAGAHALAIMTPWDEFRALAPADIAGRMAGDTVVDPYAVLDPIACRAAGLYYRAMGRPAG